jgi:hypothetical protein
VNAAPYPAALACTFEKESLAVDHERGSPQRLSSRRLLPSELGNETCSQMRGGACIRAFGPTLSHLSEPRPVGPGPFKLRSFQSI